jgi:poly-gamma-glutamate synthesis protein (capsule biosynthesis protein)
MVLFNRDNTVSLTATGDMLLHGRVYGGTNKKSDYELREQLQNVSGIIGKTDISIVNLESIIAGNEIGLSSFPRFNAPVEIGYVLKEMGVNYVTIANNHVLDKGAEGLLKSIENLEEIGLEYDGAYKSFEDRDRLRIFKKNGLKVAFVSYTRGTNGIKGPADKPYLVNSLAKTKTITICKELRRIKSKGLADIIVANMHFGEEYHLNPSHAQKELAASLADAGADVIIGHHPHVLQPPEWIETSRGTKTFVAYSLGNFFTGQNGLHRQIGAVLHLGMTKPERKYKRIEVLNPKYNLTFVERVKPKKYVIHLFRDWMKNNKYIETAEGKFLTEEVYGQVISRMQQNISDLDVV